MNRREPFATRHAELESGIEQLLRFERYYAQRLRECSTARQPNEMNLAEAGIYHELRDGPCPVGWLRERLGFDAAYLSRNLRWLELIGDVTISVRPGDRRQRLVSLTLGGRRTARILDEDRAKRARESLGQLPRRQQRRLVRAMAVIVEILQRDMLTNLVESVRDGDPASSRPRACG